MPLTAKNHCKVWGGPLKTNGWQGWEHFTTLILARDSHALSGAHQMKPPSPIQALGVL